MNSSQAALTREETKANILVVDDTPNNLRFLSQTLSEQGYKVRSVVNGQMALTVAQAAHPDLILLDIKMPQMDGYEVCQQLKADPETREIPVIFLSALDETIDKVKAFALGGVDYITKPFQIEEVLARVANQLKLRAAQTEINKLNAELEQRVQQRTAQLEREIAKRQQAQAKLLHMALHDSLTELPNRAWFTKRLQQVLNRVQQQPDYQFAVMFLDCDNFKIVNDSLGHIAGDNLLVAVARRVELCRHPVTTIARLGGDEFALLLEMFGGVDDVIRVAEQLHREMSIPFEINNYQIFVNVSIGIVLGSQIYDQPEHLLRDADTAMYRAKALGKGCYQVFNRDMYNHATAFFELQTDLRLALERQELSVYYQPIISLTTGKIVAFEALVRWNHPRRGFVSPVEFIPVAEEMGLIIAIDRWMLRQVCNQIRKWENQNLLEPSLYVNINCSAIHFSQPDLIEYIDRILETTGIAGRRLKLEITESALFSQDQAAFILLAELKKRQIQVCIDDFGTGYSSLSYLDRLSVENLKIDRSFVERITESGENLEIIRAIATLAHSLGKSVTAEGIETASQLAQIKGLNCELAQGYFFARPLDSESAGVILVTNPQW